MARGRCDACSPEIQGCNRDDHQAKKKRSRARHAETVNLKKKPYFSGKYLCLTGPDRCVDKFDGVGLVAALCACWARYRVLVAFGRLRQRHP